MSVLATLIFAKYFEVIVVQNHRDDALKCLMGQEEWAFERRNRGARSTNLISEKRRKVVLKSDGAPIKELPRCQEQETIFFLTKAKKHEGTSN